LIVFFEINTVRALNFFIIFALPLPCIETLHRLVGVRCKLWSVKKQELRKLLLKQINLINFQVGNVFSTTDTLLQRAICSRNRVGKA